MLSVDDLEALLFTAGEEGLDISVIADTFGCDLSHIEHLYTALDLVCESTSRPYRVARIQSKIMLVIKSQFSPVISKMRTTMIKAPLSKAHIEVLALILYKRNCTKTDIDAFRGVNSGQTLRTLLLRGMIEKVGVSHGSTVYALSQDMLFQLGFASYTEAPNYYEYTRMLEEIMEITSE